MQLDADTYLNLLQGNIATLQYCIIKVLKMSFNLDPYQSMYLVRYLACKMLCDFCSCTGTTTLVPPGYVFVKLPISTHSSTCYTTPFQIREVLWISESNYTTSNGLNPT